MFLILTVKKNLNLKFNYFFFEFLTVNQLFLHDKTSKYCLNAFEDRTKQVNGIKSRCSYENNKNYS